MYFNIIYTTTIFNIGKIVVKGTLAILRKVRTQYFNILHNMAGVHY